MTFEVLNFPLNVHETGDTEAQETRVKGRCIT